MVLRKEIVNLRERNHLYSGLRDPLSCILFFERQNHGKSFMLGPLRPYSHTTHCIFSFLLFKFPRLMTLR